MRYILKLNFLNMCPQYIGKGAYNVNGERYVVLTTKPEEAKRYSSSNRAKSAIERMLESGIYSNLTTEYNVCGLNERGDYLEYPNDF